MSIIFGILFYLLLLVLLIRLWFIIIPIGVIVYAANNGADFLADPDFYVKVFWVIVGLFALGLAVRIYQFIAWLFGPKKTNNHYTRVEDKTEDRLSTIRSKR